MKINIQKLVPKEWEVEKIDDDKIKVHYINKGRGNSPKPFVFPNEVVVDSQFMEAIGTYLGDGKLSKDLHHLEFTSIDKDILLFMEDFFRKRFLINSFSRKQNAFQINGKIFRILYGTITEKIISSNFYRVPLLRRAFLRGIFAAEGSINIVKSEKYIAYLGLHFSYEKENKLLCFIQKLLLIEGIVSKHIARKEKGERFLQITNWSNYSKCWEIHLFDRCKRKKERFNEQLKNTNFYVKLNKEGINFLINSNGQSHRQIAHNLKIVPSTISRLNKSRTQYLNLKDYIGLCCYNHLSINKSKKYIMNLRANRSTEFVSSPLVDFLLNQKT